MCSTSLKHDHWRCLAREPSFDSMVAGSWLETMALGASTLWSRASWA